MSRSFRVFILALSLCTVALAEGGRFTRSCAVYDDPNFKSRVMCQKRVGIKIDWAGASEHGFSQVEVGQCNGFVPDACIERAGGARRPAQTGGDDLLSFRVGLAVPLDFVVASVPYSSQSSVGFGFGGGPVLNVGIGTMLQVVLGALYHNQTLSRKFDGTGQIIDSNPAELTQRLQMLGLLAMVGVSLDGLTGGQRKPTSEVAAGELEWWLEGGLEYLSPFSASQTTNFQTSQSFSSTDRFLYALVGPRGDVLISPNVHLSGAVHGFYNLGSKGGSRLLGPRVSLAVLFSL